MGLDFASREKDTFSPSSGRARALILGRGLGREQHAEALGESGVSEDGIAKRGVGQPRDHCNLDGRL